MATKAMNLAVGINFDLLKTNLSAMYEKGENGSKILLLPTKVDSTSTVSLGEMVADFQNAFGMKEADSDKISTSLDSVKKEGSTFDPNAVTFQLQSAFLYKNSPKEGEGDLEYAIAVAVDMANALPDLGFIKLNRLYLAVWNTERTTVLKQLGTGAIDNMLKTLEA